MGQAFNKGLNVDEKKERFLNSLKNIEGKNEQQLDLIRDQGDKQLNLIGRIKTDKTKATEFGNERNKKLRELKDRIKKEDTKYGSDDQNFVYTTTGRKNTYNFTKYTYLMNFTQDVSEEK